LLGYVGVRDEEAPPAGDAGQAIDAKDKFHLVEQYRAAVAAAASPGFSAGVEQFRALTRAEPGSADLWLHLAATATRAERHELASEAYARALDLSPRSSTRLELAAASLKLRKLDDARQHAERVISDAAADKRALASAHELLARVALARRDDEGARAEARLAEESEPGRPVRAYVDGRIAHEQGHYAAATDAFGTALAATAKTGAPIIADLQYYAADTFLRLNRVSEAEYLFLEALKAAPFNARTRAGLAAVYRNTGRTDEAAATLAGH
jgi:predicted Zn-dependent protease